VGKGLLVPSLICNQCEQLQIWEILETGYHLAFPTIHPFFYQIHFFPGFDTTKIWHGNHDEKTINRETFNETEQNTVRLISLSRLFRQFLTLSQEI
jgi:hypothetical protein